MKNCSLGSFSNGVFVASPGLPPFEEYVDEISDLWDSKILTHQGKKYQQLEALMQEQFGTAHAPLFANGHLALQVLLRAYGWNSGEIITTPFTFASTTMAIAECGLKPVFSDIDPETLTIDPARVEDLITSETKAIVGVHVYGMPCDCEALDSIGKRYNLKVIYDAAHAFGERYNGKSIAQYGDASMFSFHATKVFNTVEGGALAFSDDSLYEAVCNIRQFGMIGDTETVDYIGTNAKMTEMHAAMGLCNLRHMGEYIEARKAVFDVYDEAFESIEGIRTLHYPESIVPNYAYYPIQLMEEAGTTAKQLQARLRENNVFARRYFYPLTSEFGIIHRLYNPSETPIAKKVSDRVLCLPIHPNMSPDDATAIAGFVLETIGS